MEMAATDPHPPTTIKSSPPLPWKTRLALSVISTLTDATRRHNGTVNRGLLGLLELRSSANPTPVRGVNSSDIVVDPSRNLWFRLFVPVEKADTATTLPVIVFFHGGGFVFLSADAKAYDFACRRFALKTPSVVVSVNYRLSPEHRYPCPYEDGLDVLKFLDNHPELLPQNTDLSRCFLAGDSAGGNIAHHVAVKSTSTSTPPNEPAFKRLTVSGLITIQPFFGGEERTKSEIRLNGAPLVSVPRTDWCWKAFLPVGSNRDHEAANVSGHNGFDISGIANFPRTIVFVGGFDPLQDWQKRYCDWLKKSGKDAKLVEYPDAIHAFYVFPECPEGAMLYNEVKNFVNYNN